MPAESMPRARPGALAGAGLALSLSLALPAAPPAWSAAICDHGRTVPLSSFTSDEQYQTYLREHPGAYEMTEGSPPCPTTHPRPRPLRVTVTAPSPTSSPSPSPTRRRRIADLFRLTPATRLAGGRQHSRTRRPPLPLLRLRPQAPTREEHPPDQTIIEICESLPGGNRTVTIHRDELPAYAPRVVNREPGRPQYPAEGPCLPPSPTSTSTVRAPSATPTATPIPTTTAVPASTTPAPTPTSTPTIPTTTATTTPSEPTVLPAALPPVAWTPEPEVNPPTTVVEAPPAAPVEDFDYTPGGSGPGRG
jgi:hypothetical protein